MPSNSTASPNTTHPWTANTLRAIAAGTATPDVAQRTDRLGLSAPDWAALRAADAGDQLLALLEPAEEDRTGDLIGLVETAVEQLETLERQVGRLVQAAQGRGG